MHKYDMYDNDLVICIDKILGTHIGDIVGDIVGDVLDIDIPANIPSGNITMETETALGKMHISIAKLFKANTLVFTREIGGSIYEEYTLELEDLPTNFLVYGRVLEERENGVIITNIIRNYDYCNHDDIDKRLINSEETRKVYKNNQIEQLFPNLAIDKMSLQEKFYKLKRLDDLSRMKGIKPLIDLTIKLDIPGYIGANYRRGQFINRKSIVIINEGFNIKHQDKIYDLFEYLSGNKTLEKINDLLHGNITSRNINALKEAFDPSKEDWLSYIRGFNYLLNARVCTTDSNFEGRLFALEDDFIGPSKVELGSEYYKYLKELITETFHLDVELPATSNEIFWKLRANSR